MNTSDLRVIKTRESIENAFLSLIKKKPVEKITIVELAKEARINKATFYLHYMDILDLYQHMITKHMENAFKDADYFNDFFDNPQRFCEKLTASFSSNLSIVDSLKPKGNEIALLPKTLDLLREKVYKTGRIKPSIANDFKLDALFASFLICKPRYENKNSKVMEQCMVEMVASFQPE